MTNREWKTIEGFDFKEILFEEYNHIAKITINRPRYRNAFTPLTVWEMSQAFTYCRDHLDIRVVILTGAGDKAFCSKPVIAMVNGYAIGGGHVLHVVCDLTIASENARFGQTGPKVGSFDAGLGASYLARIIGQKKAREMWYLCQQYTAQEALDMGLVNKVVPLDKLEDSTPSLTDRPEYRNWRATRPCFITLSTRRKREEGPSSRSASPISISTHSFLKQLD